MLKITYPTSTLSDLELNQDFVDYNRRIKIEINRIYDKKFGVRGADTFDWTIADAQTYEIDVDKTLTEFEKVINKLSKKIVPSENDSSQKQLVALHDTASSVLGILSKLSTLVDKKLVSPAFTQGVLEQYQDILDGYDQLKFKKIN